MAYPIDKKLVIAVASSALFDLSESERIFQKGLDIYRQYQRKKENVSLRPGVAFPLVRRLLRLNAGVPENEAPVEVVLLSRNDPDTGLRVLNSIEKHRLAISRAVFVSGGNPFRYMNALNASLFLSANVGDVRRPFSVGYLRVVYFLLPLPIGRTTWSCGSRLTSTASSRTTHRKRSTRRRGSRLFRNQRYAKLWNR